VSFFETIGAAHGNAITGRNCGRGTEAEFIRNAGYRISSDFFGIWLEKRQLASAPPSCGRGAARGINDLPWGLPPRGVLEGEMRRKLLMTLALAAALAMAGVGSGMAQEGGRGRGGRGGARGK
jgi:hypothetical protein